MKTISKFLLFITIIISLTACSTTKPMSVQDRKTIHTVTVDPNINKPAQVYYFGPGLAYMGGIISGAVSEHAANKLQKCIVDNNIHIDQIVRNQLISQLKNAGLIFVAQPPADANMTINIKTYGFSVPNGFSFVVVPILRLEVDMMRNNQVVWSNSYYLDPLFGKMPEYHSNDLINNPKLITEAWNLAAQKAVKNILSNLQTNN